MLKLIHTDTDQNQFLCNINGPMKVKGFYFVVDGTSDTGQTLALYDIGRMFLYGRGGRQLVGIDFDYLYELNKIWYGWDNDLLQEADECYAAVYIPRGFMDDNIELWEADDNGTFRINFNNAFATKMASVQVRLYADVDEGVSQYQLTISQQELVEGAAGTFGRQFNHENIAQAFFSDRPTAGQSLDLGGSDVTRLTGNIGNLHLNAELDDLVSLTHGLYKSEEHADVDNVARIFWSDGDLNSRIHDSLTCEITATDAFNAQFAFVGMLFNPDKMIISETESANRLVMNADQKRIEGKHRAADSLDQIVEARTIMKD